MINLTSLPHEFIFVFNEVLKVATTVADLPSIGLNKTTLTPVSESLIDCFPETNVAFVADVIETYCEKLIYILPTFGL